VVSRPRGLCFNCSLDPAIRQLHPSASPYGPKADRRQLDGEHLTPGPRDNALGPQWAVIGRRPDGSRLVLAPQEYEFSLTREQAERQARRFLEGGLEGYVELTVEAHNQPPARRFPLPLERPMS
jgi:hypothetical protein